MTLFFAEFFLARKFGKVFGERTNKYSAPKKICESSPCKNVIPIPIWKPTTCLKILARCLRYVFLQKAIIISMNWIIKSVFVVEMQHFCCVGDTEILYKI